MKKHEEHNGGIRLASPIPNKNHFGSGYNIDNIDKVFDIRLKENFKLFVSGPSRCGKTVFIAKLIENIQSFAKQPPTSIIYVYKVWQDKYDEMESLGVNFMKDSENIIDNIKSAAKGQPVLVIFDDLVGSKSLKNIADMFTVDARHMNISMVFLTQRLFVNDEYFRQISQNSDYFCLLKNPRNSSEIRNLAQQITPGNMILVDIYEDATVKPFSYLFLNLTQKCDESVKYLSDIFDDDVKVYTHEGKKFKKSIGEGNFRSFRLKEDMQRGIELKEFKPISKINNSNYIAPNWQRQNQNVYFQPIQNKAEKCIPCQHEDLNERHRKHAIKSETESTSINTLLPSNQYTQTIRPQYNSTATETDMLQHRLIQTTKPQQESIGIETSMNRDTDTQTDQMRYVNRGSNTYSMGNALGIQTDPIISSNRGSNTDLFGNTIAMQTESGGVSNTGTNTVETGEPTYRSQYARQIAAMPMDTTESSTLYHIPQQSISHTKPAGIEYRQTHGIENMERDVIDYQTQKPLHVPQPITHTEKLRQIESSTIYHIPQLSISHAQPPPLQYTQQKTMHTPIQSIQPSAISYTPVQSIQNTKPLAVTNSQPSALQYDQSRVIPQIQQAVIFTI